MVKLGDPCRLRRVPGVGFVILRKNTQPHAFIWSQNFGADFFLGFTLPKNATAQAG